MELREGYVGFAAIATAAFRLLLQQRLSSLEMDFIQNLNHVDCHTID